jgi:hypothetical protein
MRAFEIIIPSVVPNALVGAIHPNGNARDSHDAR